MELGAQFLEIAKVYGVGIALFIPLLVYVIKKNDKQEERSAVREAAYQEVIRNVCEKIYPLSTDSNAVAHGLADDVEELHVKVADTKDKVDSLNTKVDMIGHKVDMIGTKIDTVHQKIVVNQ